MSRMREQAQAATKEAFKRMMDAATKAANLMHILSEETEYPAEAEKFRHSSKEWQKSAAVAAKHWREL